MFNARFIALPVIALTVIVALAHAHSHPGVSQGEAPTVYRAVSYSSPNAGAQPSCAIASHATASVIR